MASPKRNPYSRRGAGERPNGSTTYIYRSIRLHPDIWTGLERVSVREHVSINSLVNALLQLALETDQTALGQEHVHAACTQWRTRWEHTETAKRRLRLEEGE